jgi:Fic family protein
LGLSGLLLLDRGSVTWQAKGLTSTLVKVLNALSRADRELGKADLIEGVWGYDYHPLQHDPLVYSTISRLKATMGTFAGWIETSEKGYSLRSDVELRHFGGKFVESADREENETVKTRETPASTGEESLNHRQIMIMRELKRREFLAVRESMKIFKVSEITASRDLSSLCKMGLVSRVGRGRSTRYRFSSRRPE